MPHFYFDTYDGNTFLKDEDGQELDGIEAVRLQAQSGLADMAQDVVPGDGHDWTMTVCVRDHSGRAVLRATLVLMVAVEP